MTGPAPKPRSWLRLIGLVLLALVVIPPLTVLTHRLVGPPMTFLMVERLAGGEGMTRRWRPLSEISPNLVYAAIAAEDANYCRHRGFDLKAIERASPADLAKVEGVSAEMAKKIYDFFHAGAA